MSRAADPFESPCRTSASNTCHTACLILISFLILFPLTAMAESPVEYLSEMSLEALMDLPVNSMGFFDVPVDQAPGSVWILDEALLATVPAVNLKDMLQLVVPGVQVSNHSFLGSLYASRGSPMYDNSTSQFMWDGMNINSAGSFGVNASLKSTLLGDIARLEVSNGPSSIIHGNGAINGFVNQVPKSGSSHPGAWANAMVGFTESLVKTEAGYGHVFGVDRDLYLYAGAEGASGDHPGHDFGYGDATQGQIPGDLSVRTRDTMNYRASLNWNHNNLRVVGVVQKEWLSLDSYAGNMAASPELYYKTLAVRPAVTFPLTPTEKLSIDLPLALFDTGYISRFKKRTLTIPTIKEADHGNSDMRIETNWVFRSLRWENQQWAAGFRISHDHHRNNRYYFRSDPSQSSFGEDIDWKEFSVFTEDIIEITPGWTVTAGLRFNAIRYQLDGTGGILGNVARDSEKWFPRLATSIRVGGNGMVKLSFQEGFHYPPATAFYSDSLDPEFLETYEINYLHSLPGLGLNITLNGFFNVYKDALIAESGNIEGNLSGNQRRDFGSLGGEIMVDWKGRDGARAMLSYAYTRPHDLFDRDVQVYTANTDVTDWLCYPSHSIKALVSRRWLSDTVMTSLGVEYGSRVERPKEKWYEGRDIFDKDRFSVNFKTTCTLSDHLSLSLVINNMVDNNVPVPSFLYHRPWEGNLGDTETRCYLGLTWQ
ncbi:MAG: TonB-dependent receptor [Desulfobacteraceae bacterium]|nr:TonB-dependent receptor [Desulfobacteraceae bacterium]